MRLEPASIEVSSLLGAEVSDLDLTVLCCPEALVNQISNARVQKPGLAFAGYYDYIKAGRVQIIGASETEYLKTLSAETRRERFTDISRFEIPVFIITKGLAAFDSLIECCTAEKIPVLSSSRLSSKVIERVSFFLEEHLVPSTHLHGVLMDIYGIGVLLIGDSGVGKSESALDLITRGHSLVADDRVTVRRYPGGELIGYCEEPLRHHMELRGLGIINVQDLFGLAAVRERRTLDLVVELEHWNEDVAYDRLGLDETVFNILDSPVPYIRMPVALGRNVSILVEIAARNHVLKMQGHDSAQEFVKRLQNKTDSKASS